MFRTRFLEMMAYNNIKSYVKLSKDTGIPVSTISHWLHDNKYPSYANLVTLADYFETSMDYLAGRTNEHDFVPAQKEFRTQLEEDIITSIKKCNQIQQLQIQAFISGLLTQV